MENQTGRLQSYGNIVICPGGAVALLAEILRHMPEGERVVPLA